MKYSIFIFIILIFSCNAYQNQEQEKPDQKKVLSPVSSWLVQNEDSLFRFFNESIDTSAEKAGRGLLNSRAYVFEGGIIGSLNKKVHEIDSCIKIYYLYNPGQDPNLGILLTTDFDNNCSTHTIDSVFSDIDRLKYFQIVRYREPGGLFSGFQNEKDTVYPADISFSIMPAGEKFDIIMYSKRRYSDNTYESLKEHIFGEEVLLKKINSFKIQKTPGDTANLKTIEEIRSYFKIKGRD